MHFLDYFPRNQNSVDVQNYFVFVCTPSAQLDAAK